MGCRRRVRFFQPSPLLQALSKGRPASESFLSLSFLILIPSCGRTTSRAAWWKRCIWKKTLSCFWLIEPWQWGELQLLKQQTSPNGRSSCVEMLLFEWALIRRGQHPCVWLSFVRKTPEIETKTLKLRNRTSWRTAGGKSVDHSSTNQKARLPLMSFCLSS